MGIVKDISGQRFGKLLAIEIDATHVKKNKCRANKWICVCDCGNKTSVLITNLTGGKSKSCGCQKNLMGKLIHGLSKTGSFHSWVEMLRRCENPDAINYHLYGGRGITVCERWHKIENFFEDMGERPEGKTLDRIDTDAGYCKENCRWATKREQLLNKRNNRRILFDGRNLTVAEWADVTGINRNTIVGRLNSGWSPDRILSPPCAGVRGCGDKVAG